MILKNANVLKDDFQFHPCDIRFDEKIHEIGSVAAQDGEQIIDAKKMRLIPGLIDIHTHGALGFEANDPECDFIAWKNYLLQNGITSFLPTTISAFAPDLLAAVDRLKDIDGINLEGPFLSIEKKGAHPEETIIDIDLDLLEKIRHKVKITTVAPEMGDNLDKIRAVTEMGIKVSIGHTAANYEICRKAFDAGATHVTHTFNAMLPLHHREPGLIGAAVENDAVFCEVISDGFHLHPSIVRMLYRALGADRMVLISDSIRATGLPDGEYTSGGLPIVVRDAQARLQNGTIAGSTTNLMTIVKRAVSFGIPTEDAVKMATLTPARAIGLDNERGSITIGKRADLVLVSSDFAVEKVFYKGQEMSL